MNNLEPRWWTTSNGSVFLPYTQSSLSTESVMSTRSTLSTASVQSVASTASASITGVSSATSPVGTLSGSQTASGTPSATSTSSVGIPFSVTVTSSETVPLTITMTGSTITSSSVISTTVVSQSTSWSIVNVGGGTQQPSGTSNPQINSRTICAGDGTDTMTLGVFSTLVFGLVVGAAIWLLFAALRPRIPQLYGMRSWFCRPDLRPPPLGSGFFAFLHPPVPLVPVMPTDVSDLGDSPAGDARLFPSDDELSQRTIWIALMMILSFTFVGLAGAIPLYVINTPCIGNDAPNTRYGGQWSAIQDLSLLRLLRLLQEGNINSQPGTSNILTKRLTVDGKDYAHTARVRLLILTILLLVVAVIPALSRVLREFNKLAAYRKRWVEVRCEGLEMGWLSVHRAPGLKGLGENDVKDIFARTGMTRRAAAGTPEDPARRRRSMSPFGDDEDALTGEGYRFPREEGTEIDVTGIFSIVDTTRVSRLIRARDVVLNNLEKAECLYIDSFRLTTPASSVMDEEGAADAPGEPEVVTTGGRHISRPKPLRNSRANRHRSDLSAAPTTYMAPSSYYRLRGVRGVSGGTSTGIGQYATDNALSDDFGSRVVGSRFQEVTGQSPAGPSRRPSITFGHLPVGSHVRVNRTGELDLVDGPGPNHGEPDATEEMSGLDDGDVDNWALVNQSNQVPQILERSSFLSRLGLGLPPRSLRGNQQPLYPANISEESFFSPGEANRASTSASGSGSHDEHGRRRSTNINQLRDGPPPPTASTSARDGPPPHMRLQLQQPIVRPISGLHNEHLGSLYSEIRQWRTRLKALNIEVAEEQQNMYEDIAHGVNLRGWLLLGRGVRFIPGVRMIEGRSKDDIRWSDLQQQSGRIGTTAFWIIVLIVCVVLAGALIPVLGLFMTNAPDFAHFIPALNPLVSPKSLGPAIATTLAPSLAAILFICIALGVVHYAAQLSGAVSNSQIRLTAFKATFVVLVVVSGIWMIGLASVLFGLEALDSGSQETTTIAEGTIYAACFVLILGLNMAFIAPGLLMLQPVRLWNLIKGRWKALTPRQHFRAMYPRSYNPSFGLGACVIAVFLTLTLVIIFPLLGPPLAVLVALTLIAHRYLVGYVYGRTDRGQSGGLLQLWILRRFGTMLAMQPFLLGLILLAFHEWALAGTLLGAAAIITSIVEVFAWRKMKQPGLNSLSDSSRDSLDDFTREIKSSRGSGHVEKSLPSTPLGEAASPRATRRTLASMASVLEMITRTLALPQAATRPRGAVPLPTESINDLVSTARAASTSPDAPPQLQAQDPADEVADLLYPPELLAPDPIIWLTNDRAGVARSEAADLERYHHLGVVLSFAPSPSPEDPDTTE